MASLSLLSVLRFPECSRLSAAYCCDDTNGFFIYSPGKGGIKGFGGPLGLSKRNFGKVCRDNELTNGRATGFAKGYSGQRQHLTR